MKVSHLPKQVVISTTLAGMAFSLSNFTSQEANAFGQFHRVANSKNITVKKLSYAKAYTSRYKNQHDVMKLRKLHTVSNHKQKTNAQRQTENQTDRVKTSSLLLTRGSQGKEVKNVQMILIKIGLYHGHEDGILGPKTEAAVCALQQHYKIKADGIIGPKTKSFLAKAKKENIKISEPVAKVNKKVEIKRAAYNQNILLKVAKEYIGTPYRWGGKAPTGFDCSGFLQFVFNKMDIHLPRTVNELWNQSASVSKLSIGNLVFFETYKPGPSHAGIYLGNNQFIHASSTGVRISSLKEDYWAKRFIGTKKIITN